MGVRHERASNCDGQEAGPFHLHDGFVFKPFAPLAIFDGLRAWRRRRSEKGLGKFLPERVFDERGWIGENGFDFLFEPGLVAAAKDETGDEAGGAAGGFAEWHAESNKIFGVHWRFT
jgi:hypothetical protein